MGWVGNVLIVVGLWLVGDKKRSAFVFTTFGESVWGVYALYKHMYDLAFICAVFALLALRNWFKWAKD